jgi:hypothetical protein
LAWTHASVRQLAGDNDRILAAVSKMCKAIPEAKQTDIEAFFSGVHNEYLFEGKRLAITSPCETATVTRAG